MMAEPSPETGTLSQHVHAPAAPGESSGAPAAETNGKQPVVELRGVRRVVVPLMAGGILAGFVTSFITAAVELSATIVLSTSADQAPMSYGIYLYMQSIAGRGPGAALGVIAVAIVGLGTYMSYRLTNRSDAWTR